MKTLNLNDTALLIQNGKKAIKCNKCNANDIPSLTKSHYAKPYEEWLYKLECSHCGEYIKFINEHQVESGIYL